MNQLEQWGSEYHLVTYEVDDNGSATQALTDTKLTVDEAKQYCSENGINIEVDVVKIDRSIIRNIGDSIFSKSLAESIDFFCKYNNIITIAEGVETKEIADVCKEIGIDVLQGYYFHKPTLIESEVKAMI